MNEIALAAIGYGVVLLMALFIVAVTQRGFFFPFVRVRTSMGKLVLVKMRSVNRDHFVTGAVKEKMLHFKYNKEEFMVPIPGSEYFYRCLGTAWIDYDEDTGALVKPDFSTVSAYDPVKYSSLYVRALYKPQILSNKEILIILGICVVLLAVIVSIYMNYKNGQELIALKNLITSVPGLRPEGFT